MSDNNSWYSQGYDSTKVVEEKAKMEGGGRITRLYLKPETEREVVFLDDVPFQVHEHQYTLGDDFKNWCTCLKDISDDVPCCEKLGLKSRYLCSYYTVIDCTKYETDDGKIYQYEVKLLPAKFGTLGLLKRRASEETGPEGEQTTGLKGKMFKIYRGTKKDPVVGNEFTFKRTVDLTKVFPAANFGGKKLSELWQKGSENAGNLESLKKIFQIRLDENGKPMQVPVPFNYIERLRPAEVKDLRLLLKNATVKAFDKNPTSNGPSGADDSVPF